MCSVTLAATGAASAHRPRARARTEDDGNARSVTAHERRLRTSSQSGKVSVRCAFISDEFII